MCSKLFIALPYLVFSAKNQRAKEQPLVAKVKAPLLSLGASGAIGEALVFFPWKGLNVAREYVVPANPRTTAQNTQRGHLTAAVADIHAAQAHAVKPLVEADVRAYALWASVVKSATTWFNQACRNYIDQLVAGLLPTVFRGYTVTSTVANTVRANIYGDEIAAGKIATGNFKWGTSKTALVHTQAATPNLGANNMWADIAGLTPGVKYFVQFEAASVAGYVGCKSGIGYATCV